MGRLVISRKVGERLKIGDEIEIMITSMGQGKVDIAITAPRHIIIKRLGTHIDEEAYGLGNQSRERITKKAPEENEGF